MRLFKDLISLVFFIHLAAGKVDDVRDVRELFEFDEDIRIEPREKEENTGLNTIVTKIFREISMIFFPCSF